MKLKLSGLERTPRRGWIASKKICIRKECWVKWQVMELNGRSSCCTDPVWVRKGPRRSNQQQCSQALRLASLKSSLEQKRQFGQVKKIIRTWTRDSWPYLPRLVKTITVYIIMFHKKRFGHNMTYLTVIIYPLLEARLYLSAFSFARH